VRQRRLGIHKKGFDPAEWQRWLATGEREGPELPPGHVARLRRGIEEMRSGLRRPTDYIHGPRDEQRGGHR